MVDYRDDLQCGVNTLHYDFDKRRGVINFPDEDCCDMQGCINLFTGIDENVQRIDTFSGKDVDTIYMKRDGEWLAFPPGNYGPSR